MYQLSGWLSFIDKCDFVFEELKYDETAEEKVWYYDTINLFPFDDWWLQLEELKILIRQRYEILKY